MDELTKIVLESSVKFSELSQTIKNAENRMAEIAVLKTHISDYSKTKDVYKCGFSNHVLEAHREEILFHKAAKEAFGQHTENKKTESGIYRFLTEEERGLCRVSNDKRRK